MKLHEGTAHELLEQIREQQTSAQDIHESVLNQIQRHDDKVKAYLRVHDRNQADYSGPMPIPIAIKDNMCMEGIETTCASRILSGFKSPYDATVIRKLKESGAVLIGNTNMDEFAFGSSTENSAYQTTCNPWGLDRVPGGSSGGSAAAVAANEAIWAIGSDTGGSIRQPAAFCGVVGLKPTYGRVSRYGLIAFASSLDQIGPFTKDVTDSALLLNIISGHDPMDSTSADIPVPDYTKALVKDVKGLRIGWPKENYVDGLDPEVKAAIEEVKKVFQDNGAICVDISLPHTEYAVATYYILGTAEASSNLARFDGVQYGQRQRSSEIRKSPLVDMYEETRDAGFGPESKRRIILGTYSLSSGYYDAYYSRALKVRTLIKNDLDRAFGDVDAIITPTSPTTAFKIGERAADPLAMYLSDIFTIPANLSGMPAISLPCGFSKEGLPIGLQIVTKCFAEETLFRAAYTYEQNTPWHCKRVEL
ncbi:MAG: Asp-tRNA(Asn)/Glu-tRNA(Gln) amidotransferase subunit GatA [Candidatus Omnitrophica bacterium]|nr:Asp-tRNA(Asn)/Glu-tRNA(Gln) amidotransferase subunit GatA [Candidatus Omnitrophota bacterium]